MKYKLVTLDIKAIREELQFSQSEFADLLGVSPRTIQSCEQGWRKPSTSLERTAILLLMARRNGRSFSNNICWKETDCPPERRESCMTYLSGQEHLCWLMGGTLCKGLRLKNWHDKLSFCLDCDFFNKLLCGPLPVLPDDD